MIASISKPETLPCVLHLGDCLEVMRGMADNSVDAVVTDPPYGLAFMGKHWDHGVPGEAFWREALRVAKPGAHLLAFGGTRTYHRLACAIEDAGWEIRDCVMWVYGSGFPKSRDVSKAIDKAAGAEREIVDSYTRQGRSAGILGAAVEIQRNITAPATDAARQWQGWGTALKPAWEPIIVARKSLIGTVAENVLAHGTGGINVDGCRIGTNNTRRNSNAGTNGDGWGMGKTANINGSDAGRWPANVIHDGSDEVVGLFPETTSGGFREGTIQHSRTFNVAKGVEAERVREARAPDTGSAARFFYCAKASKKDRDEGCEGLEEGIYTLKNDCPEHIKKEIEALLNPSH